MADDITTLRTVYDHFNARNIGGVLEELTADVAWANGMDGGHVHGRDAVRDYWTRQWSLVSPRVEPLGFDVRPDGSIVVAVRQTVLDLEGRTPTGHGHGLGDRKVEHVFRLREGKIHRFDIGRDI